MKEPKPVSLPIGRARPGSCRVEVRLWPLCDLAGAVDMLAAASGQSPGTVRAEVPFVQDVRRRLRPFERHPAVARHARLRAAGLDPVRQHGVLARLDLLDRAESGFVPKDILEIFGGPDGVRRWLADLRSFARDAGYWRLHAARAAGLKAAAGALAAQMRREGHLRRIESYAGLRFDGRYVVVPAPYGEEAASSNVVLSLPDGSYRVFSFFGPAKRCPPLSLRGPSKGSVGLAFGPPHHAAFWHELGHGLLDTLSDLYRGRIAAREELFGPIRDRCYGTWLQCVKEHVVRAVMLRLIALALGEDRAARQLRTELTGGVAFPWLSAMVDRLKRYEADRARYPTLAHFFERLLEGLLGPPEEARPAEGVDPLLWEARGFSGPGQQRRALRYLELALSGGEDPSLRLKRAVCRHLLGDTRPALEEIGAVPGPYARALGERLRRGY